MTCFVFVSTLVVGQNSASSFSCFDTSFEVGQSKTLPYYNLEYSHPNVGVTTIQSDLDSIVWLMILDTNLVLEVGTHTDSRGSAKYNLHLSNTYSKFIINYLVSQGVLAKRLVAVGYGESKLLNSDEEINELDTEEEREKAHRENSRTEIRILSVSFGVFAYTDSVFEVGQVKILPMYMSRDSKPNKWHGGMKLELKSLIKFMKNHPDFTIEVGVHTDGRGSFEVNMENSYKTSTYIINYLVNKGLDSSQLIAKGYGESQLINRKDEINKLETEEEREFLHQENNRTEIKILRIN